MSNIKSSFTVNNLVLHNRLILPPLAIEKAGVNGEATQETIEHYDKISHGGYLSMVIAEHCYITLQGKASKRQLSIADDNMIDGLSEIVHTVHNNGSKIIAQISHAGGAAAHAVTGMDTVAPSYVNTKNGEADRVLSIPEIHEIVDLFAAAAKRAKETGFDGVQIHSAHGYLLNQFYSPLNNKRTDEYGGDVSGRTKIHREIIAAVRKEVGEDFPILLRLGACDYREGGNEIEDAIQAVKIFEESGIDILDISGGMNGSILKDRENEQGFYSDVTGILKQNCSMPIILTGGITDIHAADELVRTGKADFIGVGRAMMRNSKWAEEALKELELN